MLWYWLSPELLRALDDFEGGEYRRVRLAASCSEEGMLPLAAWIWVWQGTACDTRLIPRGDWLEENR